MFQICFFSLQINWKSRKNDANNFDKIETKKKKQLLKPDAPLFNVQIIKKNVKVTEYHME